MQIPCSVYSTAPKITHCTPAAVNWVHDDEDISIRKYLLGTNTREYNFQQNREVGARDSKAAYILISSSNFTTRAVFIRRERLEEGHLVGK